MTAADDLIRFKLSGEPDVVGRITSDELLSHARENGEEARRHVLADKPGDEDEYVWLDEHKSNVSPFVGKAENFTEWTGLPVSIGGEQSPYREHIQDTYETEFYNAYYGTKAWF